VGVTGLENAAASQQKFFPGLWQSKFNQTGTNGLSNKFSKQAIVVGTRKG